MFKSALPKDEVLGKYEERARKYRGSEACCRNTIFHGEEYGEFGGMYIFDSKENLEAFRSSGLAKSIGDTYKYIEPPAWKTFDVTLILQKAKK